MYTIFIVTTDVHTDEFLVNAIILGDHFIRDFQGFCNECMI
jgi:hypothetical protein